MHTQRNQSDHAFKPRNTRFRKDNMARLVVEVGFTTLSNQLRTKAHTSATFKMPNHYRMLGLMKKGEKSKKPMRNKERSEDEAKVLQKRWGLREWRWQFEDQTRIVIILHVNPGVLPQTNSTRRPAKKATHCITVDGTSPLISISCLTFNWRTLLYVPASQ